MIRIGCKVIMIYREVTINAAAQLTADIGQNNGISIITKLIIVIIIGRYRPMSFKIHNNTEGVS